MTDLEPQEASNAELADDVGQTPPPVVPWQTRKEIGRFKAYWKTVFHVLARFGNLRQELAGSVDLRAAKQFRNSTFLNVLIAFIFIIALGLRIIWAEKDAVMILSFSERSLWAILGAVLGVGVSSYLALLMYSGIVTWFFAPRRRDRCTQDRMIALSYYTCGPLAFFAFIATGLSLVGFFLPIEDGYMLLRTIRIVMLVLVGLWYLLILRAARTVVGRTWVGMATTAVLLPICCFAAPLVVFSVLPAASMWAALILSIT